MKFLSSEKLSEHKYKTPEGYLICTDAILARTGKQTYRKNEVFADSDDESEIDVDRTPEEVFSAQTLASFENKPITVEHPDSDVNAENHNQLSVGFVRDVRKATIDGRDVMIGNLVITDAKTIEEIENGEHTDLSCGYDCDIVDEANPQQRNIRGNHVALCQQGRAGIARIVDSVKDYDANAVNAVKTKIKELEDKLRRIEVENVETAESKMIKKRLDELYENLAIAMKQTADSIKPEDKLEETYKGVEIKSYLSNKNKLIYYVVNSNNPKDYPEYLHIENARKYIDIWKSEGIEKADKSWKFGDFVKDAYILVNKENNNVIIGNDGNWHPAGRHNAKRYATYEEAVRHANAMNSNWEEMINVEQVNDSTIKDSGITPNDVKVGAVFYRPYNKSNKLGVYRAVEVATIRELYAGYVQVSTKYYVIDEKAFSEGKTNVYKFDDKSAYSRKIDISPEYKRDYEFAVSSPNSKYVKRVSEHEKYRMEKIKQNLANELNEENFIKNKPNVVLKDSSIKDDWSKGNLEWIDVYYHKTKDSYYRVPTETAHSTTEYDSIHDDSSIYTMQSDAQKTLYFYIGKHKALKYGEFTTQQLDLDKIHKTPEELKKELEANGWHEVVNKPIVVDSAEDDIEELPIKLRAEMKAAKNKGACLTGIVGQLQDIVNRAKAEEKASVKEKAKKILSDLKKQFDLENLSYLTIDSAKKFEISYTDGDTTNISIVRAADIYQAITKIKNIK